MMAAMATTRRADMFTADGKPSDDDPREHGPRLSDERVTLVESLRRQRLTLEMKCLGLDAEAMARRSVEPSTMSLLGLVRHLADGERATFRVMMAGQDVPRLFGLTTFICRENHEDLLVLKELIEAGRITPVIDRSYPLSEAPEAIRYLEQGRARGKVVITV